MTWNIPANSRIFVTGQTGSGKTFFNRFLLQKQKRLSVIDPNGYIEDEHEKWGLITDTNKGLKLLENDKNARVLIPSPLGDDEWEILLWRLFEIPNQIVYIDELFGIGPAAKSKALRALYTRGRTRNIGVVGVSQRPRFIPLFCISETLYRVVFKLDLPKDREYLSQLIHPVVKEPLKGHGFILAGPERITRYTHGLNVV